MTKLEVKNLVILSLLLAQRFSQKKYFVSFVLFTCVSRTKSPLELFLKFLKIYTILFVFALMVFKISNSLLS
jgi:hypothetical protein